MFSLILNAKDSTSTFKDSKSIILDDEGHLNNISVKPTKFSILTGTLTGTNSSTTITGTNTLFTKELKVMNFLILMGNEITATYKEIQTWIKSNYGFTVKTCWIAHAKEIYNIPVKQSPIDIILI